MFIINGSDVTGVISHGRATAKEAIAFALEILGKAYQSVGSSPRMAGSGNPRISLSCSLRDADQS